MFDGLQYADVWDVLKRRLNTTHVAHGDSADSNSLTGAHGLLFRDATVAEPLQETAGTTPSRQGAGEHYGTRAARGSVDSGTPSAVRINRV